MHLQPRVIAIVTASLTFRLLPAVRVEIGVSTQIARRSEYATVRPGRRARSRPPTKIIHHPRHASDIRQGAKEADFGVSVGSRIVIAGNARVWLRIQSPRPPPSDSQCQLSDWSSSPSDSTREPSLSTLIERVQLVCLLFSMPTVESRRGHRIRVIEFGRAERRSAADSIAEPHSAS